MPALLAFGALAVLRAGVAFLTERAAFTAGAAAGAGCAAMRCRGCCMPGRRCCAAATPAIWRPSWWTRSRRLDGLFSRYVPAATFAMVGPAVVLLAVLYADPWAALLLLGCGVLVPVGMAIAGIGAAAASRNQFLAMARLQARFLDRVRGIATIVLYGRAEDEAAALSRAAADLRIRTMRVLRVAFLSSVVLDLAAALAMVVLAIHYFGLLRTDGTGGMVLWPALAVLLLTPEFFAPLRTFSAAYQDRLHATGAAEVADRTAAAAGTGAGAGDPHRRRARRDGRVRQRAPDLGCLARAGAGWPVVPAWRLAKRWCWPAHPGAGKSSVIEILLGFVRPDQRAGDDQRRRHHRPGATGAVSADRLDRPAARPVRRLDPRQHLIRPAGGFRRRGRRRRHCRPA